MIICIEIKCRITKPMVLYNLISQTNIYLLKNIFSTFFIIITKVGILHEGNLSGGKQTNTFFYLKNILWITYLGILYIFTINFD